MSPLAVTAFRVLMAVSSPVMPEADPDLRARLEAERDDRAQYVQEEQDREAVGPPDGDDCNARHKPRDRAP